MASDTSEMHTRPQSPLHQKLSEEDICHRTDTSMAREQANAWKLHGCKLAGDDAATTVSSIRFASNMPAARPHELDFSNRIDNGNLSFPCLSTQTFSQDATLSDLSQTCMSHERNCVASKACACEGAAASGRHCNVEATPATSVLGVSKICNDAIVQSHEAEGAWMRALGGSSSIVYAGGDVECQMGQQQCVDSVQEPHVFCGANQGGRRVLRGSRSFHSQYSWPTVEEAQGLESESLRSVRTNAQGTSLIEMRSSSRAGAEECVHISCLPATLSAEYREVADLGAQVQQGRQLRSHSVCYGAQHPGARHALLARHAHQLIRMRCQAPSALMLHKTAPGPHAKESMGAASCLDLGSECLDIYVKEQEISVAALLPTSTGNSDTVSSHTRSASTRPTLDEDSYDGARQSLYAGSQLTGHMSTTRGYSGMEALNAQECSRQPLWCPSGEQCSEVEAARECGQEHDAAFEIMRCSSDNCDKLSRASTESHVDPRVRVLVKFMGTCCEFITK
jgi:hypothetical protein